MPRGQQMGSGKSNEMYPQQLLGNIQFHTIGIYLRCNSLYETNLAAKLLPHGKV